MTTPPGQIKFSKEEIEKIVTYIPYNEQIRNNFETSNEEIWHVGSETMPRLSIVSEIFNHRINLSHEMKQYEGIPENIKLEDALKRFLDRLTEKAKSTVKSKTSHMRLFFDKFPTREFTTATVLKEDITSDRLYDILNDHLQSNSSELLEGDWTGTMVVSRVIPQPSSKNKNKSSNKHINFGDIRINLSRKTKLSGSGKTDLSNDHNMKKAIKDLGIITVEVQQNCFAVAVFVAMKILNNSKERNIFLADQTKFSKLFAIQLNEIQQISLDSDENGKECQNFEKLHDLYLKPKGFDICVFNDQDDPSQRTLAFDSRLDDNMTYYKLNDNTINLRRCNEHYDIIQDIGKYLFGRKTNFCKKYMKTVKDKLNHICLTESLCIKCYSNCASSDFSRNNSSKCPLCDIYFYNQTCLSEHYRKKHPSPQGNKLSTCQLFKYCNDCNSIVRRFSFTNNKEQTTNHNCKKTYCKTCKKIRETQHNCFIPIPKKQNKTDKIEIYVYGFETKTDFEQNGILVPYYCIVHKLCNRCSNKKFNDLTTSHSNCCGKRCHKFSGNEYLNSFSDYFIQKSKQNCKSRWFAHNGGKFDSLFSLKKLVCDCNFNPMHNQRKQNYQHDIGKLSSSRQHVIFQMLFEKNNKHVRHARRGRKRFPSLQIHRHLIRQENDTRTFFRRRKHDGNRTPKIQIMVCQKRKTNLQLRRRSFQILFKRHRRIEKMLIENELHCQKRHRNRIPFRQPNNHLVILITRRLS